MVFAFERMKRQHETSVKSQRPPSRDPARVHHQSQTKTWGYALTTIALTVHSLPRTSVSGHQLEKDPKITQ
jgi:hypothetical protein